MCLFHLLSLQAPHPESELVAHPVSVSTFDVHPVSTFTDSAESQAIPPDRSNIDVKQAL